MDSHRRRVISASVIGGAFALVGGIAAHAQKPHRGHDTPQSQPPVSIRTTMDALHALGGTPRGWKFSLPSGDAVEGRRVFVALECYACHEVNGEHFPPNARTPRGPGPALTGMGAHHPAEYFAESILSPNRVIILGGGYTGVDGLSKMPSYSDSLTVKQLIDIVAYLTSLTDAAAEHGGTHGHMGGSPAKGEPIHMK
jgi:mono/diheme cytochrome c family protein